MNRHIEIAANPIVSLPDETTNSLGGVAFYCPLCICRTYIPGFKLKKTKYYMGHDCATTWSTW